ncbi:hypothetical protein HK101_002917 [Irineochytrium annulatum]|nr:hypothetical protein HK101_002917 [Irineochytrium annulatum]
MMQQLTHAVDQVGARSVAVALASVLCYVSGWLIYSPYMFGSDWTRAMKRERGAKFFDEFRRRYAEKAATKKDGRGNMDDVDAAGNPVEGDSRVGKSKGKEIAGMRWMLVGTFMTDVIRSYIHLHLLLALSSVLPTAHPLTLMESLTATFFIWVAYVVPYAFNEFVWEAREPLIPTLASSRHLTSLVVSTVAFYAVDAVSRIF